MILRIFVATSTIAGGAQLRAGDQKRDMGAGNHDTCGGSHQNSALIAATSWNRGGESRVRHDTVSPTPADSMQIYLEQYLVVSSINSISRHDVVI